MTTKDKDKPAEFKFTDDVNDDDWMSITPNDIRGALEMVVVSLLKMKEASKGAETSFTYTLNPEFTRKHDRNNDIARAKDLVDRIRKDLNKVAKNLNKVG